MQKLLVQLDDCNKGIKRLNQFMIWTIGGNVSFSHDLYILQDLIEFCLWFKCYGVDLIDEVHMAEQGWLIGELVQEG